MRHPKSDGPGCRPPVWPWQHLAIIGIAAAGIGLIASAIFDGLAAEFQLHLGSGRYSAHYLLLLLVTLPMIRLFTWLFKLGPIDPDEL